jgi:hypothetical protein
MNVERTSVDRIQDVDDLIRHQYRFVFSYNWHVPGKISVAKRPREGLQSLSGLSSFTLSAKSFLVNPTPTHTVLQTEGPCQ